jgi:hypothetical protein
MYGFRTKLACDYKQGKEADVRKTLANYEICPSSVNYGSVTFYSTDPEVERSPC